jgi:hypothetical protein
MFQSHIAGEWNKNVWNQNNFEQLRNSLQHIHSLHTINNKFLREL